MSGIITQRVYEVNTHRVRRPSRGVNNGEMGFSDNLRRLRTAAGMTQEQLAHAAGFPGQSRIANYESRKPGARMPDLMDVQKLAFALGCTVDDLIGVPGAERKGAAIRDAKEWANVLAFAQAAGLGAGIEAQEYAETHKLKFRAESLARKRLNPRELAVIYGRGDSMLPRIHSGDAILFDTSNTRPSDEALFVIFTQGVGQSEYSVKRCRLLGDIVFFDALNPEGDHQWRKPRRMDDPKNPITIVGRVRWIGSWED